MARQGFCTVAQKPTGGNALPQWEVFKPPQQPGAAPGPRAPLHTVTFAHQGLTLQVAEDESLLDAAERAGIPLPFSCRSGICTSCMAKVQGPVEQDRAHALSLKELELGWTLLCVAFPRGPITVATARTRFRHGQRLGQD